MSYFKAVVAILIILSSTWKVHSAPKMSKRTFRYHDKEIIFGKNHVDKTAIAYALCETDPFKIYAACSVIIERNAFGDRQNFNPCPVDIAVTRPNTTIEIIGVEMWEEHRIIFTWRDVKNDYSDITKVTIEIIQMQSCSLVTHELEVDDDDDMKSQFFISTSFDSFDVAFVNEDVCGDLYCRVIITESGVMSDVDIWFPDIGVIDSIGTIENHFHKLLITEGTHGDAIENLFYYLLHAEGIIELGSHNFGLDVSWSTTNDRISVCNINECKVFNYDGQYTSTIQLHVTYPISWFMGSYNLPETGYLLLVCDLHADDKYRFLKIGPLGQQEFSFPLRGLKCTQKPSHQTVNFFRKSNTEYCVTLLESLNSVCNWASFTMYCFSEEDMV